MITSDKSGDLNYFPASSEFSHIVAELEKYIENPEESNLTFDFKITSYLTSWETQFAYWVYSYSQNCITIKLLNKDLKIYRNFGVKSTDNFILLDDIKLFAVTWNRVTKFNSYGFVETEICDYILNKIKNKPKELILSTSSVKSRLRSNYLSLKQIQESGLSQTRLDKLEGVIVHYLSNFLLQQKAENKIYRHHILPLKVTTDIKLVFPQFEEQLAKFLANSNKQFDYNVFRILKVTYQLSDDFLKFYLDELSKSSKRRTYYVSVTRETYKFVLNLLWNNKKNEKEFKHYCEILLNEFPDSNHFPCPLNTILSEEQDAIIRPIFDKIVLEREARG